MTIDDAIEQLQRLKKEGVNAVVISWWDADCFGREDDENWAADAELLEEKMDWSNTHSDLEGALNIIESMYEEAE